MELIREYLLSVTAAALLCGIIGSLTGEKGSIAGITRLVCGIFLSFTIISPIASVQLQDISFLPSDIMADAQVAVAEGEDYAKRALARFIKEEAEAYILDKAQHLGVQISVEVTLSDDDKPVPVSATFTGEASPYVRHQLAKISETDLGIPEENQRWINSNNGS